MIGALMAKRAARSAFAAMNLKDVAAVMRDWADDAVLEVPGHSPVSGRFDGRARIEAWFRQWWDAVSAIQFTTRHITVENILTFGASNVVMAEFDVVEQDLEGRSYQFRGVIRLEVKSGKITNAINYFFDPEPLNEFWARSGEAATPVAAASA